MLQAIIFDLDGVLCSTDEYHYQAWKALTDQLGIPFDRARNDLLRGVSRMDSLEIILQGCARSFSAEEKAALAQQKNALYVRLLSAMGPADLSPVVRDALLSLRRAGLKLAVGSSSRNTPLILQKLGLADFFDAVADGNDVAHAKPAPDIFLCAARKLGLPPEDCLVVEDAVSGAQAAAAAQMRCACVGDAAKSGHGTWQLTTLAQLPELARTLR